MPRGTKRPFRSVERLSPQNEPELRLARIVQESLLPPALTSLPGVEVAARFLPSRAVGGDFYDYFTLGPRYLALYLGDVQGKGLEAAMYGLLVSGLMRGLDKTGNAPAAVIDQLNRRLAFRSVPGKFCCIGYAVFDLTRRRLTYANAGLPFPLLRRRGRVTSIELTGFPVAMFNPCSFHQVELKLRPGDQILFRTDGLADSLHLLRGRRGDPETQVARLFARSAADAAAHVADHFTRLVSAPHNLSRGSERMLDDATFLIVRLLR